METPELCNVRLLDQVEAEQRLGGAVVTCKVAASVIGVTRQRVYQFLKEGRLVRSAFMRGAVYAQSVRSFLAKPRGCGMKWQQTDLFPSSK